MKFKRSVILIALLGLIVGTALKPTAKEVSNGEEQFSIDKVVAVVGNSIILYSEVDDISKQLAEMRRQQGYSLDRDPMIEALEMLMEQKLLYNQAHIDSVNINSAYVSQMAEARLEEFLDQLGSVQKVEELFHRPIYEVRRELTNRIEEREYAQAMRGDITRKITITPGEVEKFYNSLPKDSLPMVPIQYVYGQITKYPLSTAEAKLRTRERMLDLRQRIIEGARFDVLARMYSEDGSAIRGGELDPQPSEGFERPFAEALEKMRVGQVSEVVETVWGFHIIELLDKTGNLYHARHILLRPKFTDTEIAETASVLDSLGNKIRADSITFSEAALKHSDDKYSKLNAGIVSNLELMEASYTMDAAVATTRHYKEDLPPDDFRALDKLEIGEVSKAFNTQDAKNNQLSKIVKLIEIIPSHPASLENDYIRLEQVALMDKQERSYEEWLNKKIRTMFIRVIPEFHNEEEFENDTWLK